MRIPPLLTWLLLTLLLAPAWAQQPQAVVPLSLWQQLTEARADAQTPEAPPLLEP
jgi:hypothetical protein